MKELQLYVGGRWHPKLSSSVAMVDDSDYDICISLLWPGSHWNFSGGYVKAQCTLDGVKKNTLLHQLILGKYIGYADHIDHNVFNNQKCNLRICSNAQNLRNRGKPFGGVFDFKGVTKMYGRRYFASIKVDYKGIHLGSFNTQDEAAVAYDKAALIYFGPFANLNFPDKIEQYRNELQVYANSI